MNRNFYELCYDQYKQEMSEADGIYQKAAVMLVVIPILAASIVKLGRIDILKLFCARVDVFFYYVSSLIAIVALVASITFLVICVYPRRYKTLANMDVWSKWRTDYQEYLKKGEEGENASNITELDKALFDNVCSRLVEAQPINAEINEKRRKAFRRSILAATIAIITIGLQVLFYLILIIQGV